MTRSSTVDLLACVMAFAGMVTGCINIEPCATLDGNGQTSRTCEAVGCSAEPDLYYSHKCETDPNNPTRCCSIKVVWSYCKNPDINQFCPGDYKGHITTDANDRVSNDPGSCVAVGNELPLPDHRYSEVCQ